MADGEKIKFNTSTYSFANATSSKECPSYGVSRQITPSDVAVHMSVKCSKSISGIPRKPRS